MRNPAASDRIPATNGVGKRVKTRNPRTAAIELGMGSHSVGALLAAPAPNGPARGKLGSVSLQTIALQEKAWEMRLDGESFYTIASALKVDLAYAYRLVDARHARTAAISVPDADRDRQAIADRLDSLRKRAAPILERKPGPDGKHPTAADAIAAGRLLLAIEAQRADLFALRVRVGADAIADALGQWVAQRAGISTTGAPTLTAEHRIGGVGEQKSSHLPEPQPESETDFSQPVETRADVVARVSEKYVVKHPKVTVGPRERPWRPVDRTNGSVVLAETRREPTEYEVMDVRSGVEALVEKVGGVVEDGE